MIARLRGELVEIGTSGALLIDCNGVGYEVIPTRALAESLEVGKPCKVLVFTDVKEDSIRLFGFASSAERTVFNLLLRVSGVGTKTAREIISSIDPQTLLRAIGQGDYAQIQRVKGIGRKSAERIVLELRDLVGGVIEAEGQGSEKTEGAGTTALSEGSIADAVDALTVLGFAKADAERAVKLALDGIRSSSTDKSPSRVEIDPGKLVSMALRFV
jgi:Holliday junction DNA helicase RuvA